MSEEAHDRLMAEMHVLPLFIARALSLMGICHNDIIALPSFQYLEDLVNVDASHSKALFETIQRHNTYASIARQEFMG